MIMRAQLAAEKSVDSLSWMKRLSSIWSTENIKIARRVIVSVVRSNGLANRRSPAGFAGASIHRYSDRVGYSCHRVHLGAALAEKSSSNGE